MFKPTVTKRKTKVVGGAPCPEELRKLGSQGLGGANHKTGRDCSTANENSVIPNNLLPPQYPIPHHCGKCSTASPRISDKLSPLKKLIISKNSAFWD